MNGSIARAVHIGAGHYLLSKDKEKLDLMKDVLSIDCESATKTVAWMVSKLEDSSICNAGVGSNLDMNGNLSCDACIANDYGESGAVASLPWIRNPIKVCYSLIEQSRNGLSHGRVAPM